MKYKVGDKVRVLPNAVEKFVRQKNIFQIGVILSISAFFYYEVLMEDGEIIYLNDENCEGVEE